MSKPPSSTRAGRSPCSRCCGIAFPSARAENNLGLILLAQGDGAGAHERLDRSLELADATIPEAGRSRVLMSLCELSLMQGDLQSARQFADRASSWPGASRSGQPGGSIWLGRIAAEVGDDELCDTEFEARFAG